MGQTQAPTSPEQIRAMVAERIGAENAVIDGTWNRRLGAGEEPVVVARPADEAGVAAVLQLANEAGWPVLAVGAGHQIQMGNISEPVRIVLALDRLRQVVYYSPTDLVVSVQPGLTLAKLGEVLAANGQMLPLDPFVPDDATVGGVVATAASGPRRALYGSLRDMVIGLRVVYPNGTVVRTGGRVVKNVAGYDLTKLFIGSLGTLAVLTEITFKLRPLPLHRETCVMTGGLTAVRDTALAVMASELIPSRLEAVYGHPAAAPGAWLLAVDCDENEPAARYQSERVTALASAAGMATQVHSGEAADEWWRGHRDRMLEASLVVRFSAAPTEILAIADALRELCEHEGAVPRFSVSFSVGVGRLFLWDAPLSLQERVVRTCRDKAAAVGGSAVVERGAAELRRAVDAFGCLGATGALMRGIKQTVDPNRILGPGRFAGGI